MSNQDVIKKQLEELESKYKKQLKGFSKKQLIKMITHLAFQQTAKNISEAAKKEETKNEANS